MKPRLRYSEPLKVWCCFGMGVWGLGSSPRIAFAVWNMRYSEIEMTRALACIREVAKL